jgi:hypothetical protein
MPQSLQHKIVLKLNCWKLKKKNTVNKKNLTVNTSLDIHSNYTKCLHDKVCLWLAAGQWFSPDTPVSSTNKTDGHDITEILLKVALTTITLTQMFAC